MESQSINLLPFLLFGVMAALAVAAVLFKRRKRDVRSQEMEQMAQQDGLGFSESDVHGLARQLQGFDLFEREGNKWGRGGKITNIISRNMGETKVWMFDYTYLVSTGKSVAEVRQTVFFADDKKWFLPNFKLKPERWWHKLMAKIGVSNDINFPENPDFSDKFWLTGGIEDLVKKQFSPDLQRFFAERPPVHIEGENYYLIAYKPGKILSPTEANTFFEHCCQLTQLLQQEGGKELLELADVKITVLKEGGAANNEQ